MHQKIIITAAALALAACAGKAKSPDQAPAPSPAPAAQAEPAAAPKAPAPSETGGKLNCAHKADKRSLEVRTKDKGCELAYTKNGQEAVVASGRSGRRHCEVSRDKIAEALKAAGFSCN